MALKPNILVAGNSSTLTKDLEAVLIQKGYALTEICTSGEILNQLNSSTNTLIILDLTSQEFDAYKLFQEISETNPESICLIISDPNTREFALKAVQSGAFIYVNKPYDPDQLLTLIQRGFEMQYAQLSTCVNEERQHTILNSIGVGVVLIDGEKHSIVDVNLAAANLLGIKKEALLENGCDKFLGSSVVGSCLLPQSEQYVETNESVLPAPDGDTIPVLKSVATVNLDGRIHYVASFVDIRKRKRLEERLLRLSECLLHLGTDYEKNINSLTALAGDLLGAQCALYNRLEGPLLHSLGRWNTPADFAEINYAAGSMCFDLISEKEKSILYVGNLLETAYVNAVYRKFNLNSYLGHIILCGENRVGALCLLYQKEYEPTQDDKQILGILAAALSTQEAIHRDRLDLIERQEYLNSIFRVAPIGIGIVSNRILQNVNDRLCEMTQFSRETLVGQSALMLYPSKEEYERVGKEKYKQISKYGTGTVETFWRRKDGEIIDVLLSSTPLDSEDLEKGVTFTALDITERKRAEEELSQSEQRFRRTFEQAAVGIAFLSIDGQFLRVNQRFIDILGYSREEILEKKFPDITYPEDVPTDIENSKLLLNGEIDTFTREKRYIHRDGKIIWVNLTVSLMSKPSGAPLHFVSIIEDIGERKQAEQQVLRERDKAQQYLDVAATIFVALDERGNITLLNKKGCEILGWEEREVLGKNWFENFISLQEREAVSNVFHQIMNGRLEFVEYHENTVLTFNGEERLFAWHNALNKDENGRIIGTVSSGIDVSDKKLADEQLRQAQKMEAIGTLAGGIAHDFNNVLAGITGYIELALDEEFLPESDAPRFLKIALETTGRAKELVKQILSFSRRDKKEEKPVRLNSLTKEVIKLLRATIPTSIDIQSRISSEPILVHADPVQLHQVLVNLCTNASYAMQETNGTLTISLEIVELSVGDAMRLSRKLQPGKVVRLTVQDTGTGMDKATLQRIFEPFYTTKPQGEGTGMGLAVVHGIVTNHGGAITAESKMGIGTTFVVYLPLLEIDEVDEAIVSEPRLLPKGNGQRILIIDDEQSIISTYIIKLERLGYIITGMNDAVSALEHFKSKPDEFDIVITDQTMPKLTGGELAAEILKIRPDLPVVICTGYSTRMTEEIAKSIGIREFLLKPVSIDKLAQTISRLLSE